MNKPKYTEEEKLARAKKNYERFWKKMEEISSDDEELDGTYASYVKLKDGTMVEDYYWSDHEITPTGLLKWFKKYNQNRNHNNIVSVRIHQDKYDKLVSMYDNLYEPLEVQGVKVIRNETV